jgi:hypothetical protein
MSVHQLLHQDGDGEWFGTDCDCEIGEDHDRSVWSLEEACPRCEADWDSHRAHGWCP